MTTTSTAADVLGAFLTAIHQGGRDSFWWGILVHDKDKICNLPEKMEPSDRKQRTIELHKIHATSLQKLSSLSDAEYHSLLTDCGIITSKRGRYGVSTNIMADKLRIFLCKYQINDYELERSQAPGSCQHSYYLRLGSK